jgi:hypothetical protein
MRLVNGDTPGPLPTATLATTEMVAVSMTETLFVRQATEP